MVWAILWYQFSDVNYTAWGKSEKAKEWRAMVDAQPIK